MADDRDESTRNLLEEIEGDWDAPSQPAEAADGPSSTPDLSEVDEGWLDDLFPEEEEPEEEEEAEPELPDERLDPEAYAAAKKAREERAAQRRAKKKAKLEAKRARQRARAAEARARQKGKAKSKPKKGRPRPEPKTARPARRQLDEPEGEPVEASDAGEAPPSSRPRRRATAASGDKKKIATQWKLLAVAVALFVAAAVFAATVSR